MKDHLLKLGLLSSLTVASAGYSKSARYMIPKGAGIYLSEELVLEASKVRLEQDLYGQVVFLRYRFPLEIEGEAARTIEMTHDELSPAGALSGPQSTATCKTEASEVNCNVDYIKDTVDPMDPEKKIFKIDTDSADQYLMARPNPTENLELLKAGQMALMHEAAGVLTIRIKK
ncbi:MAG: hypothetical protein NTV34_15520 [Proteobacteria bacterium]|nr:hypothetical protein [Pseudomonadota bacterium]